MTNEELDAIANRESPTSISTGKVLDSVVMLTPDERDALVAEVRRLRRAEANAAATLRGLGYTWGGDATGWTTAWAVADEAGHGTG